jgi:hypothetical protein
VALVGFKSAKGEHAGSRLLFFENFGVLVVPWDKTGLKTLNALASMI